MFRKQIVSFAVALALCSTLGSSCLAEQAAPAYTAGTYTGTGSGRGGELTVEVTFSEDRIEDIKVLSHNETGMLSNAAFERIPADIVEQQSLNIDTVSGATLTSFALLNATADAVEQAGGDAKALRSVEKVVPEQAEDETTDCDIVVVGSGLAGMSAAYEAAAAGEKVVLLEKLESVGGASARSGGVVCYATEEDDELEYFSAETFEKALMDGGHGSLNEAVVHKMAAMSGENVAWMRDTIGYECPYEMEEPFASDPSIMTRICNPISPDDYVYGGGGIMMQTFYDAVMASGDVTLMTETRAEELIMDGEKVAGVIASRPDGSKVTVNAKAIILATGGWDFAGYYRDTFAPGIPVDLRDHNSCLAAEGDGLAMVEKIGVDVTCDSQANLSFIFFYKAPTPENYIVVDAQGQRVTDESKNDVIQSCLMAADPNYPFYRVFDSKDEQGCLEGAEETTYLKADTIEELAELMNVDSTAFTETIERYNCMAGKADEDFGKDASRMTGITEAPFYAVITDGFTCNGSYGGPVVTENFEIMTSRDGAVVPGLYGAGEFCNINVMGYDFPHHGCNLQYCLTSGRTSGQNAAAYTD